MKKPAVQKTLYSLERSMIQLGEQINFFKQEIEKKARLNRRWIINNKIEEEDAKLMISFFSK